MVCVMMTLDHVLKMVTSFEAQTCNAIRSAYLLHRFKRRRILTLTFYNFCISTLHEVGSIVFRVVC